MINQNLVDSHARHFVYLQRVSTSELNRFLKILGELQSGILARLPGDLTEWSRTKLNAQLKILRDFQNDIYNDYLAGFNTRLDDLAQAEANFESRQLNSVLLANSSYDVLLPSTGHLLSALQITPLAIGSSGSGKLLKPFISDWKNNQIQTVNGIIRQGWFEGQTINQMAAGVKDSIAGQTRRTAQAIVRTSINHASQTARTITWNANKDLVNGWRFFAVLDSRTTQECSSIASMNRVYPPNKGPFPPRHINCRSTTIPELDERFAVDTGTPSLPNLNYYDWIKTQPKGFVLDTLGKSRGKALLTGKLSSTEFARFNLNARFEPLTVAEMVAKDKKNNLGLFD